MTIATQYGMNLYSVTLTGLDLTQTGATKIGTTDANNRFVPLFAHIELTAVTGFTSVPSVSVGTNSPNYDNGIPITTLTNMNTVNQMVMQQYANLKKSVSAGTDVYVNVTTAAIATTYIGRITILGFYY